MTGEFDRNTDRNTGRRPESDMEELSLFASRRLDAASLDFDLSGLTLGDTFEKGKRLIDAALPLVQLELIPVSGGFPGEIPSGYDVNNRFEFLQGHLESFDELLYLHFRAGMALTVQGRDDEAYFHFDQVIRDRAGAEHLPRIYVAQSMYECAKIRMGFPDPDTAVLLLEQAEDYLDRGSASKTERLLLADVLVTRDIITASYADDRTEAVPFLREGLGIGTRSDRGFSPIYANAYHALGSLETAMDHPSAAANAFGQGMLYCLNWFQFDRAHRFLPFALQMCLYSGSFDYFDDLFTAFRERVDDESYIRADRSEVPDGYVTEKLVYSSTCSYWRGLREWIRGERDLALELLRDCVQPRAHQRDAVKSVAARLEVEGKEQDAGRLRGLLEHIDDGGMPGWRS